MKPFLRILTPLLCACGSASADDLVDRAFLQVPALEIAKDDVERDKQEGRLIASRMEHFQRFSKSLPAGAGHLLVRDGVLADASNRVAYVWAWSSHMGSGEPVEFFLSSIRGGRQYESSFVTDARPSDVDAALRHIGLTPGWPFDTVGKRLWPKGDRVRVEVIRAGADGAVLDPVRIETLLHRPHQGGTGGTLRTCFRRGPLSCPTRKIPREWYTPRTNSTLSRSPPITTS
jgi:hypothetical protein